VLAVLSIEQLDAELGSMVCGVVTVSVDLKLVKPPLHSYSIKNKYHNFVSL
jgi:hypothetical protein